MNRWERIKQCFHAACDLEASARSAYLDAACAGDADLRAQVEALLSAEQDLPALLEAPAIEALIPNAGPGRMIGRRVGAYRLERLIASGGMADVFEAARADSQYDQRAAVKLLKPGLSSRELLRRFQQERQLLARLDHPNIARLLDGGVTEDGNPFFVMEYVEGKPMVASCNDLLLSIDARLALFQKVCNAVQFAHQNLVVHRDLKPSNVIVANGVPKLLDFGIAKVLSADLQGVDTAAHAQLMTPQYASPEQLCGEPITTASDVYALGVMLYELLTGQTPFQIGATAPADVARILEQEPLPPSAALRASGRPEAAAGCGRAAAERGTTPEGLQRRLRGDLDNIVLMALRREPQRRYASAERLRDDLARHLGHLPVAARRDTIAYRTVKFIKRNKGLAAAAVLTAISLVGGIIGTTWQARVASRERAAAQALLVRALEAEQAAAHEAARSRSEALAARQVASFLAALFNDADPEVSGAADLTARQLVARGAQRIDGLQNQPDIHARLSDTVGWVAMNLGLYDLAAPLLEQAVAVQTRLHGDESPETLESITSLGELRRCTSRFNEAAVLQQAALRLSREIYGHADPRVDRSLSNLALTLVEAGRGTAEPLLREAQARLEHRGDESDEAQRNRSVLLNNLAGMVKQRGDLVQAELLFRESLRLRRALAGEHHPSTARALNNLASALAGQERHAEAEPLYRSALATREALLGPWHPEVGLNHNGLAMALRARKAYEPARQHARRALAIFGALQDQAHPGTGTSLSILGRVARDEGHWAEAEQYYRAALLSYDDSVGRRHPVFTMTLSNLAEVLRDRGDVDQAAQIRFALESSRL